MKLLTKAIEKKLAKHPYNSQDGKGGDAVILVKFFSPRSNWTWYVLEVTEYDTDNNWNKVPEILYGIVSWFEIEYWNFSLSELQEMADIWKVERDMYFENVKVKDVPELKHLVEQWI